MKRNVLFGSLISLLFVYLILWKPQPGAFFSGEVGLTAALVGSPRIDFALLLKTLGEVSPLPLLICFLLTPIHVLIRSHRWTMMVGAVGKLPVGESFSLQMLGYLANSILPLRMGELIRAVLLSQRISISTSSAIATVILERVVDMVSLLGVVILGVWLFPFPKAVADYALLFGMFSGLCLLSIVYFAISRDPFGGWIGRIIGTGKIGRVIRKQGEAFASGFKLLEASHHYVIIALESAVLWAMYGLQVLLTLYAFHFTRDYAAIAAAPLVASLVILIFDAVGVSIPSAPGSVGTFHAITIFALSLFSVPADPAAGFALVLHAITIVYYLAGGLPFLWKEGVRLGELKNLKVNGNGGPVGKSEA